MNRIYSLRYSAVARGFIAVSEFARKCFHKSARRLSFPVFLLAPVLFSAGSLAGTVNNELGYQLFRKRKLTAVCSHQTRIGNLDAHLI
nr:ESPR domain-containing protein [Escherichia coli]